MKSFPKIFGSHPFSAEIHAMIFTGLSVFVPNVESKLVQPISLSFSPLTASVFDLDLVSCKGCILQKCS